LIALSATTLFSSSIAPDWRLTNLEILPSGKNQGLFAALDPGVFMARTPIPERARVITIEAALTNSPVAERGGWVAIGLGAAPGDSVNIHWPGGVLVLLNRNAEFECHYTDPATGKPAKIRLAKIKGYTADQPTQLRLSIDLQARTLTLHANGALMIDAYELANLPFEIAPRFVGVSGYAQKPGVGIVHDFTLDIER
jgi:hypothetical protein